MQTIITAVHPDDLAFELALAKRFTDAVGFIPREALEHYAALGGVIRARENGEPAGFMAATLSVKNHARTAQIYQAAIALDAQRRHHGLALLAAISDLARSRGSRTLQCWCASDLEANLFWHSAGFSQRGTRTGGTSRKRVHLLWQLALVGELPAAHAKLELPRIQTKISPPLFDTWRGH